MQISFCSTPEPVLPWEAAWLPACSSHSPFNSKGLLNYKQASCESLFPDRRRLLAAVMHCCMLPNMHMHVVLLESQECHLVNVRLRFFFFFLLCLFVCVWPLAAVVKLAVRWLECVSVPAFWHLQLLQAVNFSWWGAVPHEVEDSCRGGRQSGNTRPNEWAVYL